MLDAGTRVRKVHFSRRSHDTQYSPGPVFQETKAEDGSGNYLYLFDPSAMQSREPGLVLEYSDPMRSIVRAAPP